MANFEIFYPLLIESEGYYANVPGDHGGETYSGISRINYPGWPGWTYLDEKKQEYFGKIIPWNSHFVNLDGPVKSFYKTEYWDRMQGDKFPEQMIANPVCDWYVNSGEHALKVLQVILSVPADGEIGPKTLSALQSDCIDVKYRMLLLSRYNNERILFYQSLAAKHPDQQKFLPEWIARAKKFELQ